MKKLERLLTGPLMPGKRILAIMLPMYLDQLVFVALNMLNTGLISSSAVSAVSAVGMVDTLNNLIYPTFFAIAMGGTVLVAKAVGAGDEKTVAKSAMLSIFYSLVISSVLALVFALFRGPILSTVYARADALVLEKAKVYLLGLALASPMNAFINAGIGILRGTGETKKSLAISLATNGSYALMNLVFLPILHLDVQGLFYALLLSKLFGSLTTWLFLSRKHIFLHASFKSVLKEAKELTRELMRFAIPFMVESLFFFGALLVVQMMLVGFGTAAVAANTIAASIFALMSSAGDGLYNTTVTVVGQCLGQNGEAEAKRYVRLFLKMASVASLALTGLILLCFKPLMQLYGASSEIASTVFYLIAGAGVCLVLFWPRSFIISAGLRTAGDIRFVSLTILGTVWLVRVTVCYVLAVVLNLGVYGIWGGMCFDWLARTVIFSLRLNKK